MCSGTRDENSTIPFGIGRRKQPATDSSQNFRIRQIHDPARSTSGGNDRNPARRNRRIHTERSRNRAMMNHEMLRENLPLLHPAPTTRIAAPDSNPDAVPTHRRGASRSAPTPYAANQALLLHVLQKWQQIRTIQIARGRFMQQPHVDARRPLTPAGCAPTSAAPLPRKTSPSISVRRLPAPLAFELRAAVATAGRTTLRAISISPARAGGRMPYFVATVT